MRFQIEEFFFCYRIHATGIHIYVYCTLLFADVAYDTGEDLGFDPEPLIDRLAELSGLQL